MDRTTNHRAGHKAPVRPARSTTSSHKIVTNPKVEATRAAIIPSVPELAMNLFTAAIPDILENKSPLLDVFPRFMLQSTAAKDLIASKQRANPLRSEYDIKQEVMKELGPASLGSFQEGVEEGYPEWMLGDFNPIAHLAYKVLSPVQYELEKRYLEDAWDKPDTNIFKPLTSGQTEKYIIVDGVGTYRMIYNALGMEEESILIPSAFKILPSYAQVEYVNYNDKETIREIEAIENFFQTLEKNDYAKYSEEALLALGERHKELQAKVYKDLTIVDTAGITDPNELADLINENEERRQFRLGQAMSWETSAFKSISITKKKFDDTHKIISSQTSYQHSDELTPEMLNFVLMQQQEKRMNNLTDALDFRDTVKLSAVTNIMHALIDFDRLPSATRQLFRDRSEGHIVSSFIEGWKINDFEEDNSYFQEKLDDDIKYNAVIGLAQDLLLDPAFMLSVIGGLGKTAISKGAKHVLLKKLSKPLVSATGESVGTLSDLVDKRVFTKILKDVLKEEHVPKKVLQYLNKDSIRAVRKGHSSFIDDHVFKVLYNNPKFMELPANVKTLVFEETKSMLKEFMTAQKWDTAMTVFSVSQHLDDIGNKIDGTILRTALLPIMPAMKGTKLLFKTMYNAGLNGKEVFTEAQFVKLIASLQSSEEELINITKRYKSVTINEIAITPIQDWKMFLKELQDSFKNISDKIGGDDLASVVFGSELEIAEAALEDVRACFGALIKAHNLNFTKDFVEYDKAIKEILKVYSHPGQEPTLTGLLAILNDLLDELPNVNLSKQFDIRKGPPPIDFVLVKTFTEYKNIIKQIKAALVVSEQKANLKNFSTELVTVIKKIQTTPEDYFIKGFPGLRKLVPSIDYAVVNKLMKPSFVTGINKTIKEYIQQMKDLTKLSSLKVSDTNKAFKEINNAVDNQIAEYSKRILSKNKISKFTMKDTILFEELPGVKATLKKYPFLKPGMEGLQKEYSLAIQEANRRLDLSAGRALFSSSVDYIFKPLRDQLSEPFEKIIAQSDELLRANIQDPTTLIPMIRRKLFVSEASQSVSLRSAKELEAQLAYIRSSVILNDKKIKSLSPIKATDFESMLKRDSFVQAQAHLRYRKSLNIPEARVAEKMQKNLQDTFKKIFNENGELLGDIVAPEFPRSLDVGDQRMLSSFINIDDLPGMYADGKLENYLNYFEKRGMAPDLIEQIRLADPKDYDAQKELADLLTKLQEKCVDDFYPASIKSSNYKQKETILKALKFKPDADILNIRVPEETLTRISKAGHFTDFDTRDPVLFYRALKQFGELPLSPRMFYDDSFRGLLQILEDSKMYPELFQAFRKAGEIDRTYASLSALQNRSNRKSYNLLLEIQNKFKDKDLLEGARSLARSSLPSSEDLLGLADFKALYSNVDYIKKLTYTDLMERGILHTAYAYSYLPLEQVDVKVIEVYITALETLIAQEGIYSEGIFIQIYNAISHGLKTIQAIKKPTFAVLPGEKVLSFRSSITMQFREFYTNSIFKDIYGELRKIQFPEETISRGLTVENAAQQGRAKDLVKAIDELKGNHKLQVDQLTDLINQMEPVHDLLITLDDLMAQGLITPDVKELIIDTLAGSYHKDIRAGKMKSTSEAIRKSIQLNVYTHKASRRGSLDGIRNSILVRGGEYYDRLVAAGVSDEVLEYFSTGAHTADKDIQVQALTIYMDHPELALEYQSTELPHFLADIETNRLGIFGVNKIDMIDELAWMEFPKFDVDSNIADIAEGIMNTKTNKYVRKATDKEISRMLPTPSYLRKTNNTEEAYKLMHIALNDADIIPQDEMVVNFFKDIQKLFGDGSGVLVFHNGTVFDEPLINKALKGKLDISKTHLFKDSLLPMQQKALGANFITEDAYKEIDKMLKAYMLSVQKHGLKVFLDLSLPRNIADAVRNLHDSIERNVPKVKAPFAATDEVYDAATSAMNKKASDLLEHANEIDLYAKSTNDIAQIVEMDYGAFDDLFKDLNKLLYAQSDLYRGSRLDVVNAYVTAPSNRIEDLVIGLKELTYKGKRYFYSKTGYDLVDIEDLMDVFNKNKAVLAGQSPEHVAETLQSLANLMQETKLLELNPKFRSARPGAFTQEGLISLGNLTSTLTNYSNITTGLEDDFFDISHAFFGSVTEYQTKKMRAIMKKITNTMDYSLPYFKHLDEYDISFTDMRELLNKLIPEDHHIERNLLNTERNVVQQYATCKYLYDAYIKKPALDLFNIERIGNDSPMFMDMHTEYLMSLTDVELTPQEIRELTSLFADSQYSVNRSGYIDVLSIATTREQAYVTMTKEEIMNKMYEGGIAEQVIKHSVDNTDAYFGAQQYLGFTAQKKIRDFYVELFKLSQDNPEKYTRVSRLIQDHTYTLKHNVSVDTLNILLQDPDQVFSYMLYNQGWMYFDKRAFEASSLYKTSLKEFTEQLKINPKYTDIIRLYESDDFIVAGLDKNLRITKEHTINGMAIKAPVYCETVLEATDEYATKILEAIESTTLTNKVSLKGTLGESFSEAGFLDLYYKLPKEFREQCYDVKKLTSNLGDSGIKGNHSIFGDMTTVPMLGNKDKYIKTADLFHSMQRTISASTAKTQSEVMFLNFLLGSKSGSTLDEFFGGARNALGELVEPSRFTDNEIATAFKSDTTYVALAITNNPKYVAGGPGKSYTITELIIDNAKDVAKARELEAVVIPQNVYSSLYPYLTDTEFSNDFLKLWQKAMLITKASYLFTSGTAVRNMFDSNFKALLDTKDPRHIGNIFWASENLKNYKRVSSELFDFKKSPGHSKSEVKAFFELRGGKIHGMDHRTYMELYSFFNDGGAMSDSRMMQKTMSRYNKKQEYTESLRGLDGQIDLADISVQLMDDAADAAEIRVTDKLKSIPFGAMSYVEDITRLAHYRTLLDEGVAHSEALGRITRTHFDYSLKSAEARKMELFIPFYNYTKLNTLYWIDEVYKEPLLMRELASIWGDSWIMPTEQDETFENNLTLANQFLMGNTSFWGKHSALFHEDTNGIDLFMKINSSFMDFVQMMIDPVNSMYTKTLMPLRSFLETKPGLEGLVSSGLVDQAYGSVNSNMISLIPFIGPAYNRYVTSQESYMRKTAGYENYATALGSIDPSLFTITASYGDFTEEDWEIYNKRLASIGLVYDMIIKKYVPAEEAIATNIREAQQWAAEHNLEWDYIVDAYRPKNSMIDANQVGLSYKGSELQFVSTWDIRCEAEALEGRKWDYASKSFIDPDAVGPHEAYFDYEEYSAHMIADGYVFDHVHKKYLKADSSDVIADTWEEATEYYKTEGMAYDIISKEWKRLESCIATYGNFDAYNAKLAEWGVAYDMIDKQYVPVEQARTYAMFTTQGFFDVNLYMKYRRTEGLEYDGATKKWVPRGTATYTYDSSWDGMVSQMAANGKAWDPIKKTWVPMGTESTWAEYNHFKLTKGVEWDYQKNQWVAVGTATSKHTTRTSGPKAPSLTPNFKSNIKHKYNYVQQHEKYQQNYIEFYTQPKVRVNLRQSIDVTSTNQYEPYGGLRWHMFHR